MSKKTDSQKNERVTKKNKSRITILLKFEVCDSKRLRFIKKQEASGSLSNSGLKTPASKIPILGDICFRGINISI